MTKQISKKGQRLFTLLLAVALVLTMVLSLVACGTSTNDNSAQSGQLSVQNVSNEDAADETTGDKTGETTGTEGKEQDSTLQEGTTELSVVVGSETKKDGTSSDDSKDQTKQNNGTVVNLNKTEDTTTEDNDSDADNKENIVQTAVNNTIAPSGEYNKGIVLVKVKESFNKNDLGTLDYTSAEPLYTGSKWYSVTLSDKERTEEAVTYLTELGTFAGVDYDYVMSTGTTTESVDVSCNPDYDKHKHHHTHKVPDGWKYATENGKAPGGSSDVVIAVIDTGVDYTHMDLRNNIWINTAEIAGNGKDDDGNGYIDDVYGWDFVGNDKDPMDDNGHGTHVAGIIAAENNDIGGVGIAYNCKIMVLKAGNSSGYFNNSDIAEAIQYAYMNGASVINMSFGGSFISIAVEEALENAYNSCILVAAAGNDSRCNQIGCPLHLDAAPTYPAALPYVIGVMSTNAAGTGSAGFSNFDHYPWNGFEYEVYAVGEAVFSCWPGNKYAMLNGTSMAAPTVSAIAALLRSYYSDREVYSTKYIQSQLVNTGTVVLDSTHSLVSIYEALTQTPKPKVDLHDCYIDDDTAISGKNNGNGVMDSGETVRLYISLYNRGGVASNVNVSIDTIRNNDPALTDPYFTIVIPTMTLSDIGTYSVRESGEKYFEIVVSDDCPNDYLVDFNIRYTYENGMDEKDTTVYEDNGRQIAQFNVSRGYHLPTSINEDTTFTADRLYIVSENVVIPKGVTVTFEEGCCVQYYADTEYYDSPRFVVYGSLRFLGSSDDAVRIYPSDSYLQKGYGCVVENYGSVRLDYVQTMNFVVSTEPAATETLVTNSSLRQNPIIRRSDYTLQLYALENGTTNLLSNYYVGNNKDVCTYENCYIEELIGSDFAPTYARNNFFVHVTGNYGMLGAQKEFTNNVVYTYSIDTVEGCYFHAQSISYFYGAVSNNRFISADDTDPKSLLTMEFRPENEGDVFGNQFSSGYQKYLGQVINGYYDDTGNITVDIYGSCSDISQLWPHVVSVELFNDNGEPITTIGREVITVRVTFNRAMDTTKDTFLTFGTIEPYADYKIEGEYVSDTVWEGTYTLKAQIENGQNFLKVNNACAAEDPIKTVFGEYQLHEFTIDTTAAMSMNLQAVAKEEGIELTFAQDDYETLLGYNIYRSTEKDGNYVKLNPTVLLPEENSFLDDNAEPGKTYWYTYTVVLSDFTESNPAGKVMATAMDTMSPSLYHTPVNQGYENNNLVISATASDNVAISSVTLYYRTVGATEWKSLAMSKVNDKYSATIFGSDVTLAGLEYYIVATDGVNTVQKGDTETPYKVVVKSADSLLGMGDVDGNGAVTTKDALMLMQCLNGDLLLSDDEFKRADLNGDEKLSSAEALRILQYINGKVTTLEM